MFCSDAGPDTILVLLKFWITAFGNRSKPKLDCLYVLFLLKPNKLVCVAYPLSRNQDNVFE